MNINEKLIAMRDELDRDIALSLRDNMALSKKEVIDYTFKNYKIKSVAELGCVWNVEGVYGRYIATKNPDTKVMMVDTHWTEKATELCNAYQNIEMISDNFGNKDLSEKIGKVDAVILFDVLLHQVAPDWDQILQIYAPNTDFFLIVQPQYTASPLSVRLLDLGREEYFVNTPHSPNHPAYSDLFEKMFEINPVHNRIWRDVHHVWQWGITNEDLLFKMRGLGFDLVYLKNEGNCAGLPNFENVSFIFKKALI